MAIARLYMAFIVLLAICLSSSYAYGIDMIDRIAYLVEYDLSEYPEHIQYDLKWARFARVNGAINNIARQEGVLLFAANLVFYNIDCNVLFLSKKQYETLRSNNNDNEHMLACVPRSVLLKSDGLSINGVKILYCVVPRIECGEYYLLICDNHGRYYNDPSNDGCLVYYSANERSKYFVNIIDINADDQFWGESRIKQ